MLSGATASSRDGAYREAAKTPVMKRGFSEMVVSTEPPGAYHRRRGDQYGWWISCVLVVLAVIHCVLLGDVTLQILSGQRRTEDIRRAVSWQEWVKSKNSPGRWVQHCGVRAVDPGDSIEREYRVRCSFWDCVRRGACRTLPTQRALLTGGLLRNVGRGPTLHSVQLVLMVLMGWGLLLAHLWTLSNSRPWYAGGRINDGS